MEICGLSSGGLELRADRTSGLHLVLHLNGLIQWEKVLLPP